ncbi:serine hydrolase domain-containing protein [Paenibacillus sp. TAF58]
MQDIALQVDELLSTLQSRNEFSGTVLLSKDSEIIINQGYGFANREHKLLNTADTKFRIGSITKQFTSMAIMMLEEQGVLSVDENIKRFTPSFSNANDITIHHLLTHTSGIPNITQIPNFHELMRHPTTLENTINLFLHLEPEFKPGTRFKYTNSGYILLAYIIEQTTDLSYGDFLKRYIFEPTNMLNTGCDDHREIILHRAQGYEVDSCIVNAEYIDMTIPVGGGNLYSTTGDLFKWDQVLNTDLLVKEKTLEKIFLPHDSGYGYGWFVTNADKKKQMYHGDGIVGFKNKISRLVNERVTLILLNNISSADVDQISHEIIRISSSKQ